PPRARRRARRSRLAGRTYRVGARVLGRRVGAGKSPHRSLRQARLGAPRSGAGGASTDGGGGGFAAGTNALNRRAALLARPLVPGPRSGGAPPELRPGGGARPRRARPAVGGGLARPPPPPRPSGPRRRGGTLETRAALQGRAPTRGAVRRERRHAVFVRPLA